MFSHRDPRLTLQGRLDADLEQQCIAHPQYCFGDDGWPTAGAVESNETAVAERPLFARPHPNDGSDAPLFRRGRG